MKILLTGGSGYLGRYILECLKTAHEVTTLGRTSSAILCDLATDVPDLPVFDVVIHAAGKAHVVPKNAAEQQEFFNVNLQGTRNLLKVLEKNSRLPSGFVFISSVSVYGLESGRLVSEITPLNATESYGQSKVMAENEIQEWCNSHNIKCAILRLPLIAGINPPGNLHSIIKAISKHYYFNINHGRARKSMVLATDVANIILKASSVGGVYNLTDGYHPSFNELSHLIADQLNKPIPKNIPISIARLMGIVGDWLHIGVFNSDRVKKMTLDLTFDDSKARQMLGWNPTFVLSGFVIK